MTNKTFYKKQLVADEEGLLVVTTEYISIHETRCFYFCVPKNEKTIIRLLARKGESDLQCARRLKKLKRIDKTSSRFAFDTEEKALEHLRFLKRKQLLHTQRTIAFINKFLESSDLEATGDRRRSETSLVPGSRDLVHEYYTFD